MGQYPFSRCQWTVYLDLVFAMLKKRYTEAKFLSVDAEKYKVQFFLAKLKNAHLEVTESVAFCSLTRVQPPNMTCVHSQHMHSTERESYCVW